MIWKCVDCGYEDTVRSLICPNCATDGALTEEGEIMIEEPEQIADREWYLEARVEIIKDYGCRNVHGYIHDYKAGDRVSMVRFGRAGRPVSKDWWSSYDIDGAFIVPDDCVRIIQVTRELSPRR